MTRNTTISPSVPTTRSPLQRAWGPRFAHGLFLLASATACGQEPLCEELGDCGGAVPAGDWALAPKHASCSEDLYSPPPDTRLLRGDLPPRGLPLPDESIFDWCSLLITGSNDNPVDVAPVFFVESPPIGVASVRYAPYAADATDGSYTTSFTSTGTYYAAFPETCVQGFGAEDNAPIEEGGEPKPICERLQFGLLQTTAAGGIYRNLVCAPSKSDPGGCNCRFQLAQTVTSTGEYRTKKGGTEIKHYPTIPDFSQSATYCLKGDRLQLTGTDGEYLFGQKGLRTLDLKRINCTDGVQGELEEGVDCGLSCGVACAAPAP